MNQFNFCPNCGGSLSKGEAFKMQACGGCKVENFHSPKPVAVILVPAFQGDGAQRQDGFVGVQRNIEPQKGGLSFPGGFVDALESSQEAAVREFEEEVGINLKVLPSFQGLVFLDNLTSAGNTNLTFYKADVEPLDIDQLINFDVKEVQNVKLVTNHSQLCFPLHEKVKTQWYKQLAENHVASLVAPKRFR